MLNPPTLETIDQHVKDNLLLGVEIPCPYLKGRDGVISLQQLSGCFVMNHRYRFLTTTLANA